MTYSEHHTDNKVTENPAAENRASEKSTGSSSSSSTTYNTEPGVFLDPMEYEMIRQTYTRLLGVLNAYKAQDIERAINRYVQTSAIIDALEQTALAPRPSHAYFRAILMRYADHCILTREQAEEERKERRRQRYLAKRQQYSSWYDSPIDEDQDLLPI